MKQLLMSEEEKGRILSLHENMKIVDNVRKLQLSGKQLSEQVQPVVRNLIDTFYTAGRISNRVITTLDDVISKKQLLGRYTTNPIRNGDELMDAFIAGRLSNKHADDDAVKVLKKIFSSTDDDDLIEQLAKEMVDGDSQFKRGLIDGKYDATKIYPGKQGIAIDDYVNSLKSSQDNSIVNLGGIADFKNPENIISLLKSKFGGRNRAVDRAIDKAATQIRSYLPKSKVEAAQILDERSKQIDEMLKSKGYTPGLIESYKEELVSGWAAVKFRKIWTTMFYIFLFEVIMTSAGFTAFTPLQSLARALGLGEAFNNARDIACREGVTGACKGLGGTPGGSSGGKNGGFDPYGSN